MMVDSQESYRARGRQMKGGGRGGMRQFVRVEGSRRTAIHTDSYRRGQVRRYCELVWKQRGVNVSWEKYQRSSHVLGWRGPGGRGWEETLIF